MIGLNPNLKDITAGRAGSSTCRSFQTTTRFGDTDEISESEFLESLEAALKKHANRVKVWNLSIGTNECARWTTSRSLCTAA